MTGTTSMKRLALAAATALASASVAQSQTYIHTNTAGNWDTPASWGTNPDGMFPNAVGAVAEFSVNQTATVATTQNVGAGVTVGTINFATTSGNFRRDINMANGITLNQDGGGSGSAKIQNTANNGSGVALYFNGLAPLTLADNLEVIMSGGSTNGNGAIYFDSPIAGTGNITFDSNSSITTASTFLTNAVQKGIRLMRTNSFTGNVLIKRGIVISTGSLPTISISGETAPTSPLGAVTNTVTLGEMGSGSAALISAVSSSTYLNNINVAPTASGELRYLGSSATNSYVVASGNVSLGGDLHIRSNGTGTHSYTGIFSGTGGITRYGTGIVSLTNSANTFTGKINVNEGFISGSSFNSVNGGTPLMASSALGAPTTIGNGTIGLGALTIAGGLIYTGTGETTDRVIDLAGTTGGGSIYARGTGAINFSSNFTATGSGAKSLTLAGNSAANIDNTISGTIVDSASGATSLVKIEANKWVLTGNSTFTGKTSIQAGVLQVKSLNSVNGGAPPLTGSSLGAPTTIANGTIDIGLTTVGGTLIYTGAGETTDRVINLTGTTGGATISANGTGAVTFSGNFTATGNGAKTLTLNGTNTAANAINGAIVNSTGATSLTKSEAGSWTLGGTNTYTDATRVDGGILNVTGSHITGSNYQVGRGSGSVGTMNFSGTALTTSADMSVGVNGGTGTVNQTSGTITVGGFFFVGSRDFADTTAAPHQGTYSVQAGATTHLLSFADIGRDGGTGVVNNAGTFTVTGADLRIGGRFNSATAPGGTGTFYNTGAGTVQAPSILIATGDDPSDTGSIGTYEQSGATSSTTFTDFFAIGDYGTGVFNHSAGTLTGNILQAAYGVGGNGTYNLSGTGVANVALMEIGIAAIGAVQQTGGTLNTLDIHIGKDATGSGNYSLSGGALNVARIGRGTGAATFNFTGGTLRVKEWNPTATTPIAYAGTLGDLVQNGSGSTLSVTGNDEANVALTTTINGNYNLGAGAAIVDSGRLLTINGGMINSAGTGVVTINSGGAMASNNIRTDTLALNGTATINADGGTAGASKVETLTIGAGGKLNLKDNDLVVGSAVNFNAVRTAIIAGKTNNAAAGITSDITGFGISRGFGYAMGNDPKVSSLLAGSLAGQTFDTDSVLVKFTLLGDADLDGDTDLNDLGLWSNGYTGDLGANPPAPTTFWTGGDFDYDGDTDLNDLGLWSSTYTGDFNGGPGSLVVNAPNASPEAVAILNSMGFTVVPEPSTFVLAGVGLAGLAIAARRRK